MPPQPTRPQSRRQGHALWSMHASQIPPHSESSPLSNPIAESELESILMSLAPFGKSACWDGLTLLVLPDHLLAAGRTWARGGSSDDQLRGERRRRLHWPALQALDEKAGGDPTFLDDGLPDRGQRGVGPGRDRQVVEADHRQVHRYVHTGLRGRGHHSDGG